MTAGSNALIASAAGDQVVRGMDIDSSGNIYMGFYTTGAFAAGETLGGAKDIGVAKFNSNGDLIMLKQLGATTAAASAHLNSSAGSETTEALVVDSSGNIFIDFYTDNSFVETTGGGNDSGFVKFDSSGNVVLARQIGATTAGAETENAGCTSR